MGWPNLLVTVDHQPLVKIFSDQVLENIKNQPCLFAFKERSLIYKFRIIHVPGKHNTATDCTSRYSTLPEHSEATTIDTIQQIDRNDLASIIAAYAHDLKLRSITWDRIVAAAATDEVCRMLATNILDGFRTSRHELPSKTRQFWSIAHQLYCLKGVPIKGDKILIRKLLRTVVLEALHSALEGGYFGMV